MINLNAATRLELGGTNGAVSGSCRAPSVLVLITTVSPTVATDNYPLAQATKAIVESDKELVNSTGLKASVHSPQPTDARHRDTFVGQLDAPQSDLQMEVAEWNDDFGTYPL